MSCVYICKWSIIVFITFYCLTVVTKRKVSQLRKQFPNWEMFNNNLKRNYDFAVIGNSLGYDIYENIPHKFNSLCWALPSQQFYMQKQVINHFFSIIRQTGGRIYQIVSQRELMEIDRKKVLPFHYLILHPWLYPDNHNIKRHFPFIWIVSPLWFLKVLHVNMPTVNVKVGQALIPNLAQIKKIEQFCVERNIEYVLVYYGKVSNEVLKQVNEMHIPSMDFKEWSETIS